MAENPINQYCSLQTCSPKRIEKIRVILQNSQKMINKPLGSLQLEDVMKFLRVVNNSDFASWTKNDYKKIFKSFLKWRYKENYLKWVEDSKIKDSFRQIAKRKAFNHDKINKDTLLKPEELEALLRVTNTLKWKALLTLLYESAFRPCELLNLRWSDCVPQEKGVWRIKTISPKTKESRDIIVKDCVMHLQRWKDEYEFQNRTEQDFVFPNTKDRKKHISEGSIDVLLKRMCKRAKIRPLYPYIFRHSRIYFIQKRLGARISSKFAGHSLETSEIYNHLDCDDVEEAMLKDIYPTQELTPKEKNILKEVQEENKKLRADLDRVINVLTQRQDELEAIPYFLNIRGQKVVM